MSEIPFQSSFKLQKSKALKSPSNSDFEYFLSTKCGGGIKPIPRIYQKIGYQGDPKQIPKISVKGYRNTSRLMASGEYTVEILNRIKKTSCIKLIQRIDFDPYFCEESGLRPLAEVLKRLRKFLKTLVLIIRRVKMRGEMETFSSFFARSNNITRIKIEIPISSGVDARDFGYLTRSCKKMSSFKVLEFHIGGSKDITQSLPQARDLIASSYKVEKVKSYVHLPHEKPSLLALFSSDSKQSSAMPLKNKRLYRANSLKDWSLTFTCKTGWASYFDGTEIGQGLQAYFRNFPSYTNPIRFSLTFDKLRLSMDVFKELADLFPKLTNSRTIFLEFNNITLTQYELMVLAKGFCESKQIEHLTFKYLEKSPISPSDILPFISIIEKFSAIQKFDLFFRKVSNEEWRSSETKKRLEELQNLKYVLTKQSIHIQKMKPES